MRKFACHRAASGMAGWRSSVAAAFGLFAILIGTHDGEAASKSAKPAAIATTQQGPYLVVISIAAQRLTLYDRHGHLLDSPVSSGQSGYETPQGVFAIIERNREHFSNLYDDAPMPNMQRITWSGVAMHAGKLPGYPASHGCIRLPFDVSTQLFELTRLGTRVVVTEDDVVPVSFDHPRLFNVRSNETPATVADAGAVIKSDVRLSPPMMLGAALIGPVQATILPSATDPFADRPAGISKAAWAAELTARLAPLETAAKSAKARAAVARKEADHAMVQVLTTERMRSAVAAKVAALDATIARGARPQAMARAEQAKAAADTRLVELLNETDRLRAIEEQKRTLAARMSKEADETSEARNAAGARARDANRSLKPVSVFVSRKAGRLYVRQGFQPLFDVPVDIQDPAAAIGTHVYTALESRSGSSEMRWSAVTVVGAAPEGLPVATVKRSRRGHPQAAQIARPGQTATAALDRIDIPEEVRQRIGEMLMPGSSLIISDEAVSSETGKGTDFVILTK
jgi:L,D-transpeptidase catalytic domain